MAETFRLDSYLVVYLSSVLDLFSHPSYCGLSDAQPLLLHRQSDGKVRVTDLLNKDCGFVAPEHSALVIDKLSAGWLLLAKVNGKCACTHRPILVWAEGQESENETPDEVVRILVGGKPIKEIVR